MFCETRQSKNFISKSSCGLVTNVFIWNGFPNKTKSLKPEMVADQQITWRIHKQLAAINYWELECPDTNKGEGTTQQHEQFLKNYNMKQQVRHTRIPHKYGTRNKGLHPRLRVPSPQRLQSLILHPLNCQIIQNKTLHTSFSTTKQCTFSVKDSNLTSWIRKSSIFQKFNSIFLHFLSNQTDHHQ